MPFGGLLTLMGISSAVNGVVGATASTEAADTQAASEQQVLDLLQQDQPQAQSDISGSVAGANSTLSNYYNTNMGLLQPYMQSGTNALSQLNAMTGAGGFQAPTAAQAAQQPGYQFALQQGELAQQRSAAAAGGVLGGGEQKALQQYAQGLASTNYNNVYNQALGTYQTNFGNLAQLANLGLSATNTGVSAGNVAGTSSASNTMTGGLSQASNLHARARHLGRRAHRRRERARLGLCRQRQRHHRREQRHDQ